MALSKKKSRPISVGQYQYRWQFFENSGWNDITIQIAEGPGTKLVVQFPWEHKGTPYISLLPPVTPSIVRNLIEAAQEIGWQPDMPGKTWHLRWDNKSLTPSTACS
jgi:hypothetical protein